MKKPQLLLERVEDAEGNATTEWLGRILEHPSGRSITGLQVRLSGGGSSSLVCPETGRAQCLGAAFRISLSFFYGYIWALSIFQIHWFVNQTGELSQYENKEYLKRMSGTVSKATIPCFPSLLAGLAEGANDSCHLEPQVCVGCGWWLSFVCLFAIYTSVYKNCAH